MRGATLVIAGEGVAEIQKRFIALGALGKHRLVLLVDVGW
jgi:hypothetical protein